MDPAPPPRHGLFAALLDRLGRTTFRSLRHRDYRLYTFGQVVSFTGSWMQSAALMWLVYEQTADPIWPPLMLVAQVGPTLFLGPVGGALADRLPKRTLISVTQLLFLVTAVALTLLAAGGFTNPWLLLAVAAANGVIQAIDLPARLAYVPDLIPKEDLVNAVALNSLVFNVARAIGPAGAAGLYLLAEWYSRHVAPVASPSRAGSVLCFAGNAVSFVAVLAALWAIRARETNRPRKASHSALDGFRYVWARKPLAGLLLATWLVSVFGWPTLTLFPPYTKLVLGHAEKEYSLLVSALGGGALLAGLTNATFGSPALARRFVPLGMALTAVGILGLAVTSWMGVAAACAAVFGFGMILYLSTGQSVLQLSATDEARGRVMALWPMALSGGALVGHLLSGIAARNIPIPLLLQVMAAGVGLTAAVVTAVAWRTRR